MKKSFFVLLMLFFLIHSLNASDLNRKRILYVNSYHAGLSWSDGITKALINNLPTEKYELKIFEMDTKRNQSHEFKKQAGLKAKRLIEKFKPNLVIISDDNAAKYLVVPYYYNSNIPFVFCGINWDVKSYGFPYKNTTGMIEVQLIPQLIELLKKYSSGTKIGYLKGDSLSSRKEAVFFEKALHVDIESRFVSSIDEWKKSFLELQSKVDIVLLGNGSAIPNWDQNLSKIKSFVIQNTKIPSGSWDVGMSRLALVTYATKPEEQGEWAAKTAIKILGGKDISSIKLVKNIQAESYLNMSLSKKLNVLFPFELIDRSKIVK